MKIGDRVQHTLYGNGTVRVLDGRQAKVLFDRDLDTKASRRVWAEDLKPGDAFYPGRPTPVGGYPKAVA